MAVRIKDWMIPYTWGDGIEITNNHVINVLLREANNLIHINENREIYVDLQLDDWIEPDDDFPVGVTTGKILQEDWWQQSWLILNWKTTSGDYARLIYANDWNLYVDLWDWVWILLWWGWADFWNVKKFELNSLSDSTGQDILDWIRAWKLPIIRYNWESYMMEQERNTGCIIFCSTFSWIAHRMYNWDSAVKEWRLTLWCDNDPNVFENFTHEEKVVSPNVLDTTINYTTPYTPQYPWSPATKKYVDDWLATKQDLLTPWTRITITTDPVTWDTVISADVSGVMTYKGNVTDPTALPSSWNTQGDCRYSESDWHLYAWDGTQWKDIGGTGINLNDYFNMTINDSDDITEWSIHLFCTSIEKNYWNSKQDALTAWNGIDITNNVISAKYSAWNNITIDQNFAINNDAPFEPSNAGTMWQFLQRTNTGYQWVNPNFVTSVNWNTWAVTVSEFLPDGSWVTWQFLQKTNNWYDWVSAVLNYTPWTWININSWVISNTLPFNPWNAGTTGQVLKKTASGYEWANESWWGGGWWWGTTYYGWDYISIVGNYINNTAPFVPSQWWSTWQVLTKTSNWYAWDNIELPSGENNVKFWTINSASVGTPVLQEIAAWVQANPQNWAIINDTNPDYEDFYVFHWIDTTWAYPTVVFFGTKRVSRKQEWIDSTTQQSHWWYTKAWQWEMDILTWPNRWIHVWENPNDDTHTNYISALGAQYPVWWAFMPTDDTQPATKAYVDAAVAWWWIAYTAWDGISITNHVISNTGVLSGDSWVTYTIKVANSDPASWTANNIITFVL